MKKTFLTLLMLPLTFVFAQNPHLFETTNISVPSTAHKVLGTTNEYLATGTLQNGYTAMYKCDHGACYVTVANNNNVFINQPLGENASNVNIFEYSFWDESTRQLILTYNTKKINSQGAYEGETSYIIIFSPQGINYVPVFVKETYGFKAAITKGFVALDAKNKALNGLWVFVENGFYTVTGPARVNF